LPLRQPRCPIKQQRRKNPTRKSRNHKKTTKIVGNSVNHSGKTVASVYPKIAAAIVIAIAIATATATSRAETYWTLL